MDLNYIKFTNKEFEYIIYDTYHAAENQRSIGVKVINSKNNKVIDSKGIINSTKGTLIDFRTNELIEINEEFDF